MSKFVLLLRGQGRWAEMSPSEIEAALKSYGRWARELGAAGKLHDGEELSAEGKVITAERVVSDGPFAEAKEGVGGYFIIEAADLNEATEMSKECPHLEYGGFIEVRGTVDHSANMAPDPTAAGASY